MTIHPSIHNPIVCTSLLPLDIHFARDLVSTLFCIYIDIHSGLGNDDDVVIFWRRGPKTRLCLITATETPHFAETLANILYPDNTGGPGYPSAHTKPFFLSWMDRGVFGMACSGKTKRGNEQKAPHSGASCHAFELQFWQENHDTAMGWDCLQVPRTACLPGNRMMQGDPVSSSCSETTPSGL